MAVTACGGSSDSTTGSSSSDKGSKSLSLVAYSTPEVVYDEIEPDVPEDRRRRGRRLQVVLRRLRRAEPRGRGRPEGRRRRVLARARHRPASSRPAWSTPNWATSAEQGHRHRRRSSSFIVRKGNPKGIKTLGRPAQAGRRGAHAEPVHLGRRQVEPARRLRRQERRRQEPAGRARVPEGAHHQARQGPGQVRPRRAEQLHQRHRRRAPLLRVRGDHRAEEGPRTSTSSRPTTRSRSRTRSRVTKSARAGGEEVRRLRALQAGPGEVRRAGATGR